MTGLIFLQFQWDQFKHSFFDLFSLKYILYYLAALIIAKFSHELGHALTAKAYGLKIPTMGVAFLVLFPMLYTDTQQSWKIKNPNQRLLISVAGVWMEIYIAIIALWLWLILPFGVLKSICFFLATYSLLTTLVINISPFLRFDGYYVLSDILSMRNLQTRSFALCRWKIREWLFGFKYPKPEPFSENKTNMLIFYAFATWIYRFVLFIGIAFMVYYLFFKSLGIILFFVEIFYFVLQPILKEIKVWWRMRHKIKFNKHTIWTLLVIAIFIFILCFPFKRSLIVPAVLTYESQSLYVPEDAIVDKVLVSNGQSYIAQSPIIIFRSPKLSAHQSMLLEKKNAYVWKLRNIGHYQTHNVDKKIIEGELLEINQQIDATKAKIDGLSLDVNLNGTIDHLRSYIKPGLWMHKGQYILSVNNLNSPVIYGYPNNFDLELLQVSDKGLFIPENLSISKIPIQLASLSESSLKSLYGDMYGRSNADMIETSSYHASTFGGDIPVNNVKSELVPIQSTYIAQFKLIDLHDHILNIPPQTIRGRIFIQKRQPPYIYEAYRYIMSFLIKESSF
ncbi:M50 family metallopeptidase [Cysteiniphilum sp. JM-1]|uniref:M50 family metallopeptidase n=1 Tax=Cysteiniphilum sp. JM-1 TaxID=2610891 RepID=UPI001CD0F115|nr:M50 family metallopeptidase [Cysteiniphilum sp. JM-1]